MANPENPFIELTATYTQRSEATQRLGLEPPETAIDVYREHFCLNCTGREECKLSVIVNGKHLAVMCTTEPCASPESVDLLGKTLMRAFNPDIATAEPVDMTTDVLG